MGFSLPDTSSLPSFALPQPWQTRIHAGIQPRPLCRSGGAGTGLDLSSWSPSAWRCSCAPAKSQPVGEPGATGAHADNRDPDAGSGPRPAWSAVTSLHCWLALRWAPACLWLSPISDLRCQVHAGRPCSQRVHASSQGIQLLIGTQLVLAPAPGPGPAGHVCLRQCYMAITSQ